LGLCLAGDLAHRVMETQAQDLDEEVDGVAGPVTLGVTNFFTIVLLTVVASYGS
jgi:hypothetical protein